MLVRIHELAVREFDEAIEWYDLQSKGLGKRFRKSVIEQIEKIKKNPKWYLTEETNVHKAYVPKFPYKILFTIEGEQSIVVWAIAHTHRKPSYWQSRTR